MNDDKEPPKPSAKIKEFPRAKRFTPEDYEAQPFTHICVSAGPVLSFAFAIHMRHDGLYYVCRNCGLGLTHQEILDIYAEEA